MRSVRALPTASVALVALVAAAPVARALAAPPTGENRLARAELLLTGPLEAVEVSAEPPGGSTRVAARLTAGERRRVEVPLSLAAARVVDAAPRATPRLVVEAAVGAPSGGEARFAGWREPALRWEELPASLRARPRPPAVPAEGSRPRPRTSALAALATLAIAVLAAGRRPPEGRRDASALPVLALGALGALAVARLPFVAPTPSGTRSVLEGDVASGRWLEVRAGADELALAPDGWFRLECEPASAAVDWAVEPERGRARWVARAAGAGLWAFRRWSPAGALGAARNGALDLEATWVRGAVGAWSYRGPWRTGEALPAAREGPSPPGWLAAAAPPGVGVLIGRASTGGGDASAPRWLRLVGFAGE